MRNAYRWVGVLVGSAILLSAWCACAQDWPQWRGPNRDGKVVGFVPPAAMPAALNQKWKVNVGLGDATPALVGGKLYVFARQGDEEVTLCLNAADGKVLWQDKAPAPAISGPAASHSGPRSSPAVAEGKVVTMGAAGVVSCLDAATGAVAWRKDAFPGMVPRFFTSSSPLIADGMAIAQPGGQGTGGIVAFDLATGNVKWQWTAEAPQYSSPVLMTVGGTKIIVAMSEQSVVGVAEADGKLLWKIPFVPQGMSYNSATPIVDGDTLIFTGTGVGRGTKAVQIEKQGDAFTVKDLWLNDQIASQFNSPILDNGFIYGMRSTGILYCLNAKTGQQAWVGTDAVGPRGFGQLVDVGPALLLLPNTGQMIVYAANGGAYAELTRLKVADTPTYAAPVVSGKSIFVKDQDSVILWSLE